MNTLMSQAEKRLREIYSIEENSKEFSYKFTIDERAYLFINDYFSPNIRKLNQINSVYFLLEGIKYGHLNNVNSNVQFAFLKDKVVFFCGDSIRLALRLNETFEDIKIDIYNERFSITELLDGSAYDLCYNEKLQELNDSIGSRITFQEFLSIFSKDIEDIIESNIEHGDFNFIKRKEFIEKYTDINKDNSDNSDPHISFSLKKTDFKNMLSPFFFSHRIDQIFEIISLITFYKNIENPSFKFKDTVLSLSLNSHSDMDRFKEEHDRYTISFPETFFTPFQFSLNISTASHFISLEEFDANNLNPINTDGFENIKEKIKEDITNIFEKRLQISRKDISVPYLSLLTMVTS